MTLSNPAQYISGRTVQEQMNSLIDYVDQRAGDVALDAIASDVAQVHQDMLDADADASAAAASAAAAAGTLANAVKKTGEASQSIAGDIAVAGDLSAGGDLGVTGDAGVQGQLSVLGGCDLRAPVKIPVTPTNNDDAASKKYVDDSLDNYATMVRTVNNQPIDGVKTLIKQGSGLVNILKRHRTITAAEVTASTIWTEVATFTSAYQHMKIRITRCYGNSDAVMEGMISVQGTTIGTCKFFDVHNNTSSIGFDAGSIIVAIDSSNVVHVFMKMVKSGSTTYASSAFEIMSVFNPFSDSLFKVDPSSITLPDTNPVAEPQQADYAGYKVMA